MNPIIARDFQNRCIAGLVMLGIDSDKNIMWDGTKKNWTAWMWLDDGVYDDEPDGGRALVAEYLKGGYDKIIEALP